MSFLKNLLVKNVYDAALTLLPPEPGIQFIGFTLSDDKVNGVTVVQSGGTISAAQLTFAANLTPIVGVVQAQKTTSGGGAIMAVIAQSAATGLGGAGGAAVLQGGAGDGAGATGIGEVLSGDSGAGLSAGHAAGDFLALGPSPAATGRIRLSNTDSVSWHNAAATLDIAAVSVDASNNIALAGGTAAAASNPGGITLTPQAPNAGAGSTATGTPGSVVVNVAVPVSTGTEGTLQFKRNGSAYAIFQGATFSPGGFSALYMGPAVAPVSNNYTVISDGINTSINGSTSCNLQVAGTTFAICQAGGVQIGATVAFGGGTGVVGITNATVAPTTNPSGAGILYSQSGAGKWRGSSGTVTTFGPAEPHCDVCGSDFVTEHESEVYGYLSVCLKCMADELGERPWIRRAKKDS